MQSDPGAFRPSCWVLAPPDDSRARDYAGALERRGFAPLLVDVDLQAARPPTGTFAIVGLFTPVTADALGVHVAEFADRVEALERRGAALLGLSLGELPSALRRFRVADAGRAAPDAVARLVQDLASLTVLSGRDFDALVARLLPVIGLAPHADASASDAGIDVVAEGHDGIRLVQIKHTRADISVNELAGFAGRGLAVGPAGARLLLITDGDLTSSAWHFVRGLGDRMEVVTRAEFWRLYARAFFSGALDW